MKKAHLLSLLAFVLAAVVTAPVNAKITLKFAFWGDNAIEAKKNIEILKVFEKRTGIGVTPILTSYGSQNEKMITMATAGTAPDLFWLQYVTSVPQFANAKIAADLTPYIKRDKSLNPNDLFSVAWKTGQYKGGQYAMLRDICQWSLAYNKEILEKTGLVPPKESWNLDSLVEYGRKLTKDLDGNGKPDQFMAGDYLWDTAVYQFGGEFWERDGGKSKILDKAVLDGIQWYLDLKGKYHILPKPGESGDFNTKKSAFGFCGPWSWAPFATTLKFKWDIINLPVGPTGKSVSQLLGQPVCMYSRTKHPKEAYELIKFLCTDPEAQMMQATLGIAMPTIKKLAYSDTFAQAAAAPDGVKYYLNTLEDAYIQPQFVREPTAKQMITDALSPVFLGKKTPEQALRSLKPSLDAFLGRK